MKNTKRFALIAAPIAALLFTGAFQSVIGADSKVKATAVAAPTAVKAGSKAVMTVHIAVEDGWHIYPKKPDDEFTTPTAFTAKRVAGVTFGAPVYPTAQTIPNPLEPGKTMHVYHGGDTVIKVPFTVAKTAKPGKLTLAGTVQAQSCNDNSCLPPVSLPVTATVTVK